MADLPSAGDVAQVVHTCKCPKAQQYLGLIVTVTAVGAAGFGQCDYCLRVFHACQRADVRTATLGGSYPRNWLRRYQPLSELESIDLHTELDAEQPSEVMA